MANPGWYNDKTDPALARWHDGEAWTAHTVRKADWIGRQEPPPPHVLWPERFAPAPPVAPTWEPPAYAEPTIHPGRSVFADPGGVALLAADATELPYDDGYEDVNEEEYEDEYDAGYDDDGDDPGRRGPGRARWAWVGAPVAVIGLLVAVGSMVSGGDGGGSDDEPSAETSSLGDINAALADARTGLTVDISDRDLQSLVLGLCSLADGGDVDRLARQAAAMVATTAELDPVLAAAGRGARTYCPDDARTAVLRSDAVLAAASVLTTSTTPPPSDEAEDATTAVTSRRTTPTSARASQNQVTRTETRSQSSTNPTLPSSADSDDQTSVGNSTSTTVNGTVVTQETTTTTTTTTTAASDTTASTTAE